jgi:hypothetical protein
VYHVGYGRRYQRQRNSLIRKVCHLSTFKNTNASVDFESRPIEEQVRVGDQVRIDGELYRAQIGYYLLIQGILTVIETEHAKL